MLSWGDKRLRFRYEGPPWKPKRRWKDRLRDVVVVEKGRVVVCGGITSDTYYYRSDLRLKDEIEPIDGALHKLMAMHGVSFRLKEEEDDSADVEDASLPAGPLEGVDARASEEPYGEPEDSPRRLGLIAQDVERVCPEVVSTDEDGYKSMDATQLNAIFVEAIKDQQKIIDAQQTRLDAQQARLERMEKALTKLGIEL